MSDDDDLDLVDGLAIDAPADDCHDLSRELLLHRLELAQRDVRRLQQRLVDHEQELREERLRHADTVKRLADARYHLTIAEGLRW